MQVKGTCREWVSKYLKKHKNVHYLSALLNTLKLLLVGTSGSILHNFLLCNTIKFCFCNSRLDVGRESGKYICTPPPP